MQLNIIWSQVPGQVSNTKSRVDPQGPLIHDSQRMIQNKFGNPIILTRLPPPSQYFNVFSLAPPSEQPLHS